MTPAISGRMTSLPVSSSKARSVASDMKVPPWTMQCSPISLKSRSLMTLNRAFLMTEYERPAATSPMVAPSFCACLTREFMKTVQREPRSTGSVALVAAVANSRTSIFMESAKDAIKEPQPAEQASFSMMCSMTPSLTCRHFMSWPPISRMKSTSGTNALAPRR